jgi:hypothetical protein
MKLKSSLIKLVLIFCFPLVGFSQESSSADGEESKNEISLFLGGTTSEDKTAFAIGVDYQYRIKKWVGIGGLVDYAMGDFKSTLVGIPLFLHASDFEFTIAPAVEFSDGDAAIALRLGAAYEFKTSVVSISPSVFFDTVRDDKPAWVYGISLGFDL